MRPFTLFYSFNLFNPFNFRSRFPSFCSLAAFLIAFLASLDVRAASLVVGTNLNITKSSVNNAETTIAINPLNPNNLFADDTWAVLGRYTTNGGTSWLTSNTSAMPSSDGDVATAWDTYGNLFLVQFGGTSLKIAV